MLVRVHSDLHMEFTENKFEIEPLETDKDTLLVLAGDINIGSLVRHVMEDWANRFKYVVYVAGNHEYYGGCIQLVNGFIKDEFDDYDNVFFLEAEWIKLEDVYIWGDTFWTTLYDPDPSFDWFIKHYINDFKCIHRINDSNGKMVKFDPACWRYYHNESFKSLNTFLNDHAEDKCIVVTHHAPSQESSATRYLGSRGQPAYYSPYDMYIEMHPQIKLWCHGHMHNNSDYVIGESRIVCNPYGYAGYDLNSNFQSTKVIEV